VVTFSLAAVWFYGENAMVKFEPRKSRRHKEEEAPDEEEAEVGESAIQEPAEEPPAEEAASEESAAEEPSEALALAESSSEPAAEEEPARAGEATELAPPPEGETLADDGDQAEDDLTASGRRKSGAAARDVETGGSRRTRRSSVRYAAEEPKGRMPVSVRARCSDCFYVHDVTVSEMNKAISCPACEHTAENLPEEEIQALFKEQKNRVKWSIIASAAFIVGVIFLLCALIAAIKTLNLKEFVPAAFTAATPDYTWAYVLLVLGCIGVLVSLVGGIIASLRRYVAEF
jgi:hypothetical protein